MNRCETKPRRGRLTFVNAEALVHISLDPLVCHGQPCLRGTRIPVSVVLDCLGDAMTVEEIRAQYSSLTTEAVLAAAANGAALARDFW